MTKKVKSRVPDVWSTVPWLTLYTIGGHRRYKVDMAEQSQHSSGHTSPSELTTAGMTAARPQVAALDE